ncbi:MAG TPA: DUF3499 family protein [Euzebya sp.]|nr:DUF3499 family protein [Euzebya sp.]
MADHRPRTARRPSEAMRSCIRTGCRWPAAATLSYRYATAEVWLSDLGDQHPSTHDLCPHHADSLRVPRGWTLVDDRCPVEAVHEPSAAELVQRVTQLHSRVDAIIERPVSHVRSRYADLLDNLPTYDPGHEGDPDDPARDAPADGMRAPDLVPVGVSHELAPIVRDLATVRRASPAAHPHPDHGGGAQPVAEDVDLTGEAAPVDVAAPTVETDGEQAVGHVDGHAAGQDPDAVHETGIRGAIVVQLPLRVEGTDDG